ncbi:hypothetical protein [Actinoplanes sp. NPDC051859]|uniref:hypothetical protein n=1 Tax=Actinoplanes sp. NPDC051859 TaxID=3363909 RepID=UPI0037A6201F
MDRLSGVEMMGLRRLSAATSLFLALLGGVIGTAPAAKPAPAPVTVVAATAASNVDICDDFVESPVVLPASDQLRGTAIAPPADRLASQDSRDAAGPRAPPTTA